MLEIDLLPTKTHNLEPRGLMFMIDGDGIQWTVKYFSHYSNTTDNRFPVIKGKDIKECAVKLYNFIDKNYPSMLMNTKVGINKTSKFIDNE